MARLRASRRLGSRAARLAAGPCGQYERMTIGVSLLLIAVGAILKFAVTASVAGVSLGTIGIILMIIGGIGLLIALFMLGRRREDTVVREQEPVYYERDPVGPERRVR